MSEQPTVTVVIPAKNEAESIGGALRAVADQTYPSSLIEVVVVVGGATDETLEVASKLLADGPFARWSVIENPNGTTPSNLNRGLDWAEGDVIVRVDARSLIPREYVATCVDALEDASRMVIGGSQVATARSDHRRDRSIARALNHRYAMGGSRYRRMGASSGPADTVYLGVFRRAQLIAAGGWNEHFTTNQDFELNRRMAARGSVWFEADLPVSYLPRSTHRELVQQYHRFGRWKARYWRTTPDRPRSRQVVLVAGPVLGLVGFGAVIGVAGGWTLCVAPVAGVAGCWFVDATGGQPSDAMGVRLVAGATNVLIGVAWWSGVVRGLASPVSSCSVR